MGGACTPKHAPNAIVSVEVRVDGDDVVLVVSDDGPGFDASQSMNSHGLLNMSDRVAAIGGRFDVRSSSAGTSVEASVTLDRDGNGSLESSSAS